MGLQRGLDSCSCYFYIIAGVLKTANLIDPYKLGGVDDQESQDR